MRTVIVTGAAGNLGSAVVKSFLKRNYKVIACISQRDKLPIIQLPNLEFFQLDLTDSESCKIFIDSALKKHQTIDALVLTVGGFSVDTIETVTKEGFEKMFALNFMTAINIVQPVYQQMLLQQDGGRVILTGAKPGMHGREASKSVAYGFTKSLLFRLSELINEQGKTKNVSANMIVPGTIDTPQNRTAMPDADFTTWDTPEKLAEEIVSICSQEEHILVKA